jgi:hypothetical protein
MKRRVFSLSVIALAALLSASALAAQPATTARAKPKAPVVSDKVPAANASNPNNPALQPIPAAVMPAGIVPGQVVDKMDGMTQAQRDETIKAMAEKLKKMTPKERQAFFEENRKRYAAMTPEQKKALNDKLKLQSAAYIVAHKAEWEKSQADQAKLRDQYSKEFLAKMPGVERAVLQKYKELRKTHGRDYAWRMIIDDAGKGGKITPITE